MTDAEYSDWLHQDNHERVVIVEIDYQYESSGAPATGTIYLSDKEYFDPADGTVYVDCVKAVPVFARNLTGNRLGGYTSSLGTVEIDNADGGQDFILDLAIDGSEVRIYYGGRDWPIADFRLIFSALSMLASATSFDRLSLQLKDTGLLLDVSIGGTSLVGGTGANANRARPVNVGYIHNLEALVADTGALLYVHSDTGTNTTAVAVRDRGVDLGAGFTDNGDGTFNLSASPDGTVTCDVVAEPGATPPKRLLSDAMDELIGVRAGLTAASKYTGAGPTYTVGDDDDYLIGITLPEARNARDFLSELTDSGNCFWAVLRTGEFTYGRLRPNDIAGLSLTATDIVEDNIIPARAFKLDHLQPQFYRFQAYMSKNWLAQTDLAASLTPDEQAVWRRPGIYLLQSAGVGTTYNDAPELYNKSLAVSPVLSTLLSGAFDELDLPFLETWMETRRAMFLPWIEVVSVTVGIEFYTLELGDVVNLVTTRFGQSEGILFQVMSIVIRLTDAKIDLKLVRRRLLAEPPPEWTRVVEVIESTPIETAALISKPPIIVWDPFPPIFPKPGYPIDPITGGGIGFKIGPVVGSAHYTPPAYPATDGYIYIRPRGVYGGNYVEFVGPEVVRAEFNFDTTVPTITDSAFSITRTGVVATMDTDDKYEYVDTVNGSGYVFGAAIGVPAYSWEWTSGAVDVNDWNLGASAGGLIYVPANSAGLFSATADTYSLRSWVLTAGRQEYVFYVFQPLSKAFGAPFTIGITTRSTIRDSIGGYALPPIRPYPPAGSAWDGADWPLPRYRLTPKRLPHNERAYFYGMNLTAAQGSPTGYTMTTTPVVVTGQVPTIVVALPAPVISAPSGQFTRPINVALGSFQITASNSPTSYGWSRVGGLPGGLSLNTSTGFITGSPDTLGLFDNILITATNATGTGNGSFNFNIVDRTPAQATVVASGKAPTITVA